jgi:catechol 2,3-dioxygenase-like lactoylglutathione lyase family enzyme
MSQDLPSGSPVTAVVIGARNLDASIGFYKDVVGFEVIGIDVARGKAFENHWRLPAGGAAKVAMLESNGLPVGRIHLMEFNAPSRKDIWTVQGFSAFGLCNVNFYTPDIQKASRFLEDNGCKLWSEPKHYNLQLDIGTPTEVVLSGYDTVPINLVELSTGDPGTIIGDMRAFMDFIGHNAKGFSPVVTTAHIVRDLDTATTFYERVLGMGVMFDDELNTKDTNEFLGLPQDARTKIRFLQGNHMFGKVALSYPVNYDCTDLTDIALPPHIGYIAQQFIVNDLTEALEASEELDCEIFSDVTEISIPGLGNAQSYIVRNPASGGLQEILQLD